MRKSTETDKVPMVKCPGCDLELPEDDTVTQMAHMEEHHPEIIEERRKKAERLSDFAHD